MIERAGAGRGAKAGHVARHVPSPAQDPVRVKTLSPYAIRRLDLRQVGINLEGDGLLAQSSRCVLELTLISECLVALW